MKLFVFVILSISFFSLYIYKVVQYPFGIMKFFHFTEKNITSSGEFSFRSREVG